MSKSWSKIYNNKNFFRNIDSFQALKNSKIKNWSYRKLSFELFKIMNPLANKVSLKKSFSDYLNFIFNNINFIVLPILGDWNSYTVHLPL